MSELTSMMNIGKEMERKLISIGSRDIPPLKQTLDEDINDELQFLYFEKI